MIIINLRGVSWNYTCKKQPWSQTMWLSRIWLFEPLKRTLRFLLDESQTTLFLIFHHLRIEGLAHRKDFIGFQCQKDFIGAPQRFNSPYQSLKGYQSKLLKILGALNKIVWMFILFKLILRNCVSKLVAPMEFGDVNNGWCRSPIRFLSLHLCPQQRCS